MKNKLYNIFYTFKLHIFLIFICSYKIKLVLLSPNLLIT